MAFALTCSCPNAGIGKDCNFLLIIFQPFINPQANALTCIGAPALQIVICATSPYQSGIDDGFFDGTVTWAHLPKLMYLKV
jgi:hypothetical protein